ncbi:kinase-like domain-containing protein [Chytriomyces sp. MP71]|nr:kinase-like domain-containing protein [Chytriomyces sp. MP71]
MGNLCACAARSDEDVDEIVDITHFEIGRVIGKGSFGKVCIVKHKKTGKEFALKYINKGMIASKNLAKHMIEERRILEEAKSSFICNLRYAFQDDIHILMVIDMSLGGDIAFHLKFGGAFSEERTKFYVAEISCGLAFLHSLKIVHRDLKPGNVLLSETGHASLTDFNLATHYQDGHLLTSRSGTLKYMAPEVVAHKGYLNAIDWWSLGVMTFEMLFGLVPFDNSTEKEIKRAILNEPVKMPADSAMTFKVSENSRAIIFGLLEREPSHRLGSKETGGVTAIQKHIWYNGWDWDKVEKQQLPVPFLPDVR